MKLTYEERTTVTSEVEAVNRRPLTCIYEGEVEEVLTQSHLYYGRRLFDE